MSILTSLSEHDFAARFLDALFESRPLRAALVTYTSVLFAIGSFAISWYTIKGIVASARHGVSMGKYWNGVWDPLRVVIGLGLLAPNPAWGGLSASQALIFKGAEISAQMANQVWQSFANSVLADGYAVAVPGSGGRELARDILFLETCSAAANALERVGGFSASPPPPPAGIETPRGIAWRYGDACGTLRLPPIEGQDEFNVARHEAATAMIGEIRAFAADAIQAAIPSGDYVLSQAPEVVAAVAAWLHTLASNYDDAVGKAAADAAAKQQAAARERILAYMNQHGWTVAGTAWRTLAQASALAAELAASRHELIRDETNLAASPDVRRATEVVAAFLRLGEREVKLSPSDLTAIADAESDLLTQALAPLRDSLAGWNTGDGEDADPVAWLTTWGHSLMLGGQAVIAAGVPLSIAAKNALSDAAGGDGPWDWLSPIARGLAVAAIVGGVILAYLLPLLPFIFTVFLVLGWVIAICEAHLAAPVFALMMARFEGGDEFFGRTQAPGLQLLFSLLLRPVLGVLALCTSYVILPEMLRFLDETLAVAALGGQGGHIVGIFGILGLTAASLYLAWEVAKRTLSLVSTMPERIGRWFGSPDSSREESSNALAVLAALGQGTQRAAQSAAPTVSKRPKGPLPGPAEGAGTDGARAPRGTIGGARDGRG